MQIKAKLMNTTDSQFLPSRKYPNDAGADLRARIAQPILLHPEYIEKIPTGIAVEIPKGYFGLILPRSGTSLAGKVAITGTIDSGYTGELAMSILNTISETVKIEPMERLAQLIILPCVSAEFELVEELQESDRGNSGYGSSGRF